MLRRAWVFLALVSVGIVAAPASAQKSFVTFESGPVRPLALSPDGSRLFVANTPDGHLEIFDVTAQGLSHAGAVPVGLEPVTVAARTNDEVWVVNQLSDSVSIVDVPSRRVVRTLLVGDEPRDIVFAGAAKGRAFITTAHRGQNMRVALLARPRVANGRRGEDDKLFPHRGGAKPDLDPFGAGLGIAIEVCAVERDEERPRFQRVVAFGNVDGVRELLAVLVRPAALLDDFAQFCSGGTPGGRADRLLDGGEVELSKLGDDRGAFIFVFFGEGAARQLSDVVLQKRRHEDRDHRFGLAT